MVLGIFNNALDLENAVEQFLSKGFHHSDFSVLMSTARKRDKLFQNRTYNSEALEEVVVMSATLGALIGIGLTDADAKRYEAAINKSGIILAVHVTNRSRRKMAGEIFANYKAHDIAVSTEDRVNFDDYHYIPSGRDNPFTERRKNIL